LKRMKIRAVRDVAYNVCTYAVGNESEDET